MSTESMPDFNCYQLLNIDPKQENFATAFQAEFRRLSLFCHPDKAASFSVEKLSPYQATIFQQTKNTLPAADQNNLIAILGEFYKKIIRAREILTHPPAPQKPEAKQPPTRKPREKKPSNLEKGEKYFTGSASRDKSRAIFTALFNKITNFEAIKRAENRRHDPPVVYFSIIDGMGVNLYPRLKTFKTEAALAAHLEVIFCEGGEFETYLNTKKIGGKSLRNHAKEGTVLAHGGQNKFLSAILEILKYQEGTSKANHDNAEYFIHFWHHFRDQAKAAKSAEAAADMHSSTPITSASSSSSSNSTPTPSFQPQSSSSSSSFFSRTSTPVQPASWAPGLDFNFDRIPQPAAGANPENRKRHRDPGEETDLSSDKHAKII